MAGALIDTGNPWIPFIGGILVGGVVAPPLMEAVGGALGGLLGEDSDVAYAYHGFMRRGGLGHGHGHRGMRHRHMRPPIVAPGHMAPLHALPRHRDFEKEYTSVEQTYSNQIAIRH